MAECCSSYALAWFWSFWKGRTLSWMASPEINGAALRTSSSDCSIVELSGPLRGWKKKLTSERGGTTKRKDVSYVAPNGEEIKSSRQLIRYLKTHPGVLTAENFVWKTVNEPRRSARLNRKPGRRIHFQELDMIPTKRRKRNRSSIGRNTQGSGIRTSRGGDNLKVAKQKLLVDSQPLVASEPHLCTLQNSYAEIGAAKIGDTKNLENIASSQVDKQIHAADATEIPDLKFLFNDEIVKVGGNEEAVVIDERIRLAIMYTAADSLDAPVEEMSLSADMNIEFEEITHGIGSAEVERSLAVDNVKVDNSAHSIMTSPVETSDSANETEAELKINRVKYKSEEDKLVVEGILKEEIVQCTKEEIVEMVFDMDVDEMTMIVQAVEDMYENRAASPMLQTSHALAEKTVTFVAKTKPLHEDKLVPEKPLEG